MIKTYQDAVKFLEKFIPSPSKKYPGNFGFYRMQYLANLLGNPERQYKTIHVGGTSGKGSTATILASIVATKYRVGLYTSPHLGKYTERIKINGQDVNDEDFVSFLNRLNEVILRMKKSSYGAPSHFEIVTALAFLYFYTKKVDIAVIEVGLGGSVDATNIIKPEVSILTNVGLDHTCVLGDTVEKIARDKIGIIKYGVPVVSGVRQQSVQYIVDGKSQKENAEVSFLGRDFQYKVRDISDEGSIFDYYGNRTYKDSRISLLGEHQVENAAIAIRAIECMNAGMHKWRISEENIRTGLKNVFIQGRMEIVRRNPMMILDGAHNPDKVKALVLAVQTILPKKKVKVLVAIKKDKDAKEMLRRLIPICQDIVFTTFRLHGDMGEIVSYDPTELKKIIDEVDKNLIVSIVTKARNAYETTLNKANKDDVILVTGSLYLVGEIRPILS